MSRDEVRSLDRWAIEEMHVPGVVLMENAGRSCVEVLWPRLEKRPLPSVAVFCGSGNNGGDGFVIARHLFNRGVPVRIVLCAAREKIRGDAEINLRIVEAMRIPIETLNTASDTLVSDVRQICKAIGWIVDAFLGTGLTGPLSDSAARLIALMNAAGKPILAVDIPSGLDCDRGIPLPVCIEAQLTVTFAALKQGFAANPESRRAAGDIFIASIGIEPEGLGA